MNLSQNALTGQSKLLPTITLVGKPTGLNALAGGGRGTAYTFEVHPFGQFFQPLPGVYAICKQTAPQTLSVLYIGESEDLDARVGEGFPSHHKWAAAILNGATHVCVLVVRGGKIDRCAVETSLRHTYNPPLNDQ